MMGEGVERKWLWERGIGRLEGEGNRAAMGEWVRSVIRNG